MASWKRIGNMDSLPKLRMPDSPDNSLGPGELSPSRGSCNTVLFLPGMDGTSELFERIMREMPREWKSIAPIYPRDVIVSYAQLLRMLQSIAPQSLPFVLVAESYSTPVAIQLAATRPGNLKGLVLCNGFATSPFKGWRRFAAKLLSPLLFRLPHTSAVIDHFLIGLDPEPSLRHLVRRTIASVKPQVLSARLVSILECDVRADLARISIPTLYLRGQNDALIGGASVDEILSENRIVSVESIPGPHLLLQREPQRSAEIIQRFAKTAFAVANTEQSALLRASRNGPEEPRQQQ
jgi:pimeloyl-ACP methyl ester carboxylesterase